MRLARPKESDVDTTRDFLSAAESVLERQKFSWAEPQYNWEDWNDDDEDRIYIEKVRKRIAEEDDIEEDKVDNRILMYEFLKHKFAPCSCDFNRVIFGMYAIIPYLNQNISYMDFADGIVDLHVANEQ